MYLKKLLPSLFQVLFLFLSLLGVYTVCRAVFFLTNSAHFDGVSNYELLRLLWHGLRYDLAAICTLNVLYLLLLLLPIPLRKSRKYIKWIGALFVATNGIALFFEIADWVYFPFNHKRATFEVVEMLLRKGDFVQLLPSFFQAFWYLFLVGLGLLLLLGFIHKRASLIGFKSEQPFYGTTSQKALLALSKTILLIIVSGLAVIGIRGGLQYIPINIRNAIEVTQAQYTPIVLNTPFSIISTIQGSDVLKEINFMPADSANALVPTIKHFSKATPNRKNVVIIIVEGLSSEFTKLSGTGISHTPFIDSLMGSSVTFTHAFANGQRSIEGIPAIIAGVPTLTNEPFITSQYSNNKIDAIPALLQKEGYSTAFFHGATNGSMSFDVFAKSAGYKQYFGRTEYNNEHDFDGTWGIYDEPFLQFSLRKINTFTQPFLATIFTLTSHHPYSIPPQYAHKFDKGTLPPHESIGYVDYALARFFAAAKQQSWYSNTLFVITADHCSPYSGQSYYSSGAGKLLIPLIILDPLKPEVNNYHSLITQQIDILPTTMALLGYNKPFFALGNNALDSSLNRFAIAGLGSNIEYFDHKYWFKYAQQQMRELYQLPTDSLGQRNVISDSLSYSDLKNSVKQFQAFYQNYSHALRNNKMSAVNK